MGQGILYHRDLGYDSPFGGSGSNSKARNCPLRAHKGGGGAEGHQDVFSILEIVEPKENRTLMPETSVG